MIDRLPQQILDVYLHNQHAGKLYSHRSELSFRYEPGYLHSEKPISLSASLPLQAQKFGHAVTFAFFSNLLPEEDVRRRLARYLRLSEQNTFALLKEIGGECAGAVSIYPEGMSPLLGTSPSYLVLNDKQAKDVLQALDKRPMMVGEEDIRISGAGAQDKLMVAFVDGKIAIPKGSTASTHIIKPTIKGLEETVQNEFFCMRLAKAIGLPVPEVNIYWLEGQPYYLIERYDRLKKAHGTVVRLHQEDFCQAMQLPPEMKYESEGGPTLNQCFDLLDDRIKSGAMAGKNKITFLQGVIFNYIIGNGDAHGKNFSLLYDGEIETLAPFYDILCTLVFNDAYKAKMAMKIGGKDKFKDVHSRHWEHLGEKIGFRKDFVRRQLLTVSNDMARTATKLHAELMASPSTASPVYEKIVAVIVNHHRRLGNQEKQI